MWDQKPHQSVENSKSAIANYESIYVEMFICNFTSVIIVIPILTLVKRHPKNFAGMHNLPYKGYSTIYDTKECHLALLALPFNQRP